MECENCGTPITNLPTGRRKQFCRDACRKQYRRNANASKQQASTEYSADNIKIIDPLEDMRWDWKLAETWAYQYGKDYDFVYRSIRACREVGVAPEDYFKPRYLEDDKSIPINKEVCQASRRVQADWFRQAQADSQSEGDVQTTH